MSQYGGGLAGVADAFNAACADGQEQDSGLSLRAAVVRIGTRVGLRRTPSTNPSMRRNKYRCQAASATSRRSKMRRRTLVRSPSGRSQQTLCALNPGRLRSNCSALGTRSMLSSSSPPNGSTGSTTSAHTHTAATSTRRARGPPRRPGSSPAAGRVVARPSLRTCRDESSDARVRPWPMGQRLALTWPATLPDVLPACQQSVLGPDRCRQWRLILVQTVVL